MTRTAWGSGSLSKQGYWVLYKDGRLVREHRYLWEKANGPIPEGYDIHHIKSRGAGGKNEGNTVGLCRRAHDQLHTMGSKSFPLAYGVNLWEEAV